MDTRRILIVTVLLVAGLLGTATSGEGADTLQVLARDNFFQPPSLDVTTGDTVVWKNTGDVAHTVTAVDGSFDQTLRVGQEYRITPSRPGEIAYYCRFHGNSQGSGMAGTLNVTGDALRTKDRIAGDSRIETAVALSQYRFPEGADEVYLSRSDVNPDALVAGSLTAGPILLVPSCGTLPQVVKDEIDRLNPVKVVALGGQAAVCEDILDQAVAR